MYKVTNMVSEKTNRSIPNQFVLTIPGPNKWYDGTETGSGDVFQSYNSLICFREYNGKVYLDKTFWSYSKTTSKYRIKKICYTINNKKRENMNTKIKQYAILNVKDYTFTEYFLSFDDFGKVYCKYSYDVIPYGDCKKFVNPLIHFIELSHKYITDEKNELCEVLENKSYDYMVKKFQELF